MKAFFNTRALALCAATALFGSSAFAAGTESSEARAKYNQERAACMAGQSGQDRATCLKEAGAALQEAQRNNLDNGNDAYHKNAMQRCKNVLPQDKADCRMRVNGDVSDSSGSVKGGGVIKETVSRTVGPVTLVPADQQPIASEPRPMPRPVPPSPASRPASSMQ